MEYRVLGTSPLEVSLLGLGCVSFGRVEERDAVGVVHAALDAGVNLFDTSPSYGAGRSEELLGRGLKGRREQAFIATKVGSRLTGGPMPDGLRRDNMVAACEDSLRRLDTDYIDLYQVHWPDPNVPPEETLAAFDELVRSGKVRYIGVANYYGWEIAHNAWLSDQNGWARYVSAQYPYSLLDRRADENVVPAVQHYGLSLLPYFPLANGLLTGRYRRGDAVPEESRFSEERLANLWLTDRNFSLIEMLTGFGEARGHTLIELAFAWLASKPYVASVIAGASRAEQIASNIHAVDWRLTPEEMQEIDELQGIYPRGNRAWNTPPRF